MKRLDLVKKIDIRVREIIKFKRCGCKKYYESLYDELVSGINKVLFAPADSRYAEVVVDLIRAMYKQPNCHEIYCCTSGLSHYALECIEKIEKEKTSLSKEEEAEFRKYTVLSVKLEEQKYKMMKEPCHTYSSLSSDFDDNSYLTDVLDDRFETIYSYYKNSIDFSYDSVAIDSLLGASEIYYSSVNSKACKYLISEMKRRPEKIYDELETIISWYNAEKENEKDDEIRRISNNYLKGLSLVATAVHELKTLERNESGDIPKYVNPNKTLF